MHTEAIFREPVNCARYVNAFNKGSEICDFVCSNILDILNQKNETLLCYDSFRVLASPYSVRLTDSSQLR